MTASNKRDLVAQWAFDTRPLLLRFHLWLEDIQVEWVGGAAEKGYDHYSFAPGGIRRCLAMTAGVTALGTQLFGRFGEGRGADKQGLNQVKKDADAISAYVMSEALWHFTRRLPENHAIMVCLGEGLMPKAGETPEMGANPLLGFGRIYARPEVARLIDLRVHRRSTTRPTAGAASTGRCASAASPSGAPRSTPSRTPHASPRARRPARWPCCTCSTSRWW